MKYERKDILFHFSWFSSGSPLCKNSFLLVSRRGAGRAQSMGVREPRGEHRRPAALLADSEQRKLLLVFENAFSIRRKHILIARNLRRMAEGNVVRIFLVVP